VAFSVRFRPRAARQFRKLPRADQARLAPTIEALARDPFPPGHRKLAGTDALYRIRVGDFRVIYRVREGELLVLVVLLGQRRDIYRMLRRLEE